jgi:hypothetical protein
MQEWGAAIGVVALVLLLLTVAIRRSARRPGSAEDRILTMKWEMAEGFAQSGQAISGYALLAVSLAGAKLRFQHGEPEAAARVTAYQDVMSGFAARHSLDPGEMAEAREAADAAVAQCARFSADGGFEAMRKQLEAEKHSAR